MAITSDIVSVSIGLIILVAIFSIGPLIGDKIDNAASIDNGSAWDDTNMSGVQGVDVWKDNASLILLALLVLILAIVIGYIMMMQGRTT